MTVGMGLFGWYDDVPPRGKLCPRPHQPLKLSTCQVRERREKFVEGRNRGRIRRKGETGGVKGEKEGEKREFRCSCGAGSEAEEEKNAAGWVRDHFGGW